MGTPSWPAQLYLFIPIPYSAVVTIIPRERQVNFKVMEPSTLGYVIFFAAVGVVVLTCICCCICRLCDGEGEGDRDSEGGHGDGDGGDCGGGGD